VFRRSFDGYQSEVTPMFTAALIFLGLATMTVVALFLLQKKAPAETAGPPAVSEGRQEEKLPWDANANWEDIKAAWMAESGARHETLTSQFAATSSWGRTFALCAVLCIVGVLLEAHFNCRISIADILAALERHDVASASSHGSTLPRR
jgi:hypothetical protein